MAKIIAAITLFISLVSVSTLFGYLNHERSLAPRSSATTSTGSISTSAEVGKGFKGTKHSTMVTQSGDTQESANSKFEARQQARKIVNCIRLQNSSRRAEELLATSTSSLNSSQLAQQDAALSKASRDIEHAAADGSCAEIDASKLKSQLYPALLQAAESGDWDAASCYTMAPFDAPDDQMNADKVAIYRDAAQRFIVEGMRRGEWRFVTLAELAVGNRTIRHRGQYKNNLFHQIITPDAKMLYGYVRLERLGATGAYANQLDDQLTAMETTLSSEDMGEMNRWAEEEYRINFADKPKIEESPSICDLH